MSYNKSDTKKAPKTTASPAAHGRGADEETSSSGSPKIVLDSYGVGRCEGRCVESCHRYRAFSGPEQVSTPIQTDSAAAQIATSFSRESNGTALTKVIVSVVHQAFWNS